MFNRKKSNVTYNSKCQPISLEQAYVHLAKISNYEQHENLDFGIVENKCLKDNSVIPSGKYDVYILGNSDPHIELTLEQVIQMSTISENIVFDIPANIDETSMLIRKFIVKRIFMIKSFRDKMGLNLSLNIHIEDTGSVEDRETWMPLEDTNQDIYKKLSILFNMTYETVVECIEECKELEDYVVNELKSLSEDDE